MKSIAYAKIKFVVLFGRYVMNTDRAKLSCQLSEQFGKKLNDIRT